METIEERYKNNYDLINSLTAEDWVALLKEIAILYLPFIKNEEIEAIKNIKRVRIEYSEFGLTKIIMFTHEFAYEDFCLELNNASIIISRQQNHAKSEKLYELPIVIIRKLLKSKLCN